MEVYDDLELYERFRFRRADILEIVDEVRDAVEHPVTRHGSLSALLQVLIALRFYATGCFQNMVGEMVGIGQSTASRTIHRVTNALLTHMGDWVKMPSQHDADAQKLKFFRLAGFPNVIGCIDGTHVRIQAPTTNEHEYVNRKNYHSINVQVTYNLKTTIILMTQLALFPSPRIPYLPQFHHSRTHFTRRLPP